MVSVLADKMLGTLTHRGPDDSGIWSDDGIALGNRRLAILDLSPNGHQPMTTERAGRTEALTWNGECYGHQSLRVGFDHNWRGSSDTETILALLARSHDPVWVCRKLRGMFAFCYWDGQRLIIARDRLGIKPCYYARTTEGTWLVASEVRALRAVAKFDLDWVSLAAYLRLGYIPSPRTAFVGIHELPPGHVGIIEQDRITLTPYWSLSAADERFPDRAGGVKVSRNSGPGLAAGPLPALFQDAVRSHLQSDVPVALFTGGGTDSHAIASTASATGTTLPLLHVLGNYQDSRDALTIAKTHHGLFHVSNPIPSREDLDHFIAVMDGPTVDGVNIWLAAGLAKQHGFKVVLSGLGGDELFAGYPTFRKIALVRHLQRLRVPQEAFVLGSSRLHDAFAGARTFQSAYAAVRGVFSKSETIALTRGPLQDACRALDISTVLPDATDMRRMELSAYMRSQLLRDCDVFSMAHGVEVRPVFLDHPFVETALAHPLTRRQFCRALGLPAPGKKRGFSLPIDQWMRGPWRMDLWGTAHLLNVAALPTLEKAHWSRRWATLVLARWLRGVM